MSRTYSNFLIFEDVLDNIPNVSPTITQAVNILLNPEVKIIEEDCGTLLGQIVETNLELEGWIETATGDPLTSERIINLLEAGSYKIGIRTLGTCLSHSDGGVCRKCFQSSFIGETPPEIGSVQTVASYQIYQTDMITGDGYTTTFSLSQTEDEWYQVKVIKDGILITSGYTLGTDSITFDVAPDPVELYVIHFLKLNTDPFQGYIAKTYSGSLLGMQPLPTIRPLLRVSLYEKQFSDNLVAQILKETRKLKGIPETYIEFMNNVHSKLEKVILALYLYAIYSNVEV